MNKYATSPVSWAYCKLCKALAPKTRGHELLHKPCKHNINRCVCE